MIGYHTPYNRAFSDGSKFPKIQDNMQKLDTKIAKLTHPPLQKARAHGPHLIKNIVNFEQVQRRATKFILNYPPADYKSRLTSLHLLPFIYWLELQDFLFLIKLGVQNFL